MRNQVAVQRVTLRDGAIVHFTEAGYGHPVILLHGGMGDMQSWSLQMAAFSDHYRTISYSRRYSEPNSNRFTVMREPAASDSNDLLELMQRLGVRSAHLIGTSYGASVALAFTLAWATRVTSLTLCEPPMHPWVKELPIGAIAHERFMRDVWDPAAAKFRQGNSIAAMTILAKAFGVPAGDVACGYPLTMRNARAMKALLLSEQPFPNFDRRAVENLTIPALVVRGERSDLIHTIGANELSRSLQGVRTAVVPDAGHRVPVENPQGFNRVVLDFLGGIARTSEPI